jgi:lipocalin
MRYLPFIGCIVFAIHILGVSTCTPPSFSTIAVQTNFNLNKFLGVWFEIKWLPETPHAASDIWRNLYQSFQLNNSSTQIIIPGRARAGDNTTCFDTTSWLVYANNSAKMILQTQDSNSPTFVNWPYYVLLTDYDNFALVYGCGTVNYTYTDPCSNPFMWLYSRTTSLSTVYSTLLDSYIENELCLNLTSLEITPQDGIQCYYSCSTIHYPALILFIFLFFLYI